MTREEADNRMRTAQQIMTKIKHLLQQEKIDLETYQVLTNLALVKVTEARNDISEAY